MTDKRTIPEQQLLEIKDNFAFFDTDNNGSIDVEEFTKLLLVISPTATKDHAERGFALIDENNDGHIDLKEFIGWWQTCWWEY